MVALLGFLVMGMGEPRHAFPTQTAKSQRLPLHYPVHPLNNIQEIWRETFESGRGGWQLDAPWEVGTPLYGPSSPYEGSQVLGTDLDTTYASNINALALSPPISLPSIDTTIEHLWLVFAEYIETESCCDFATVEIHTGTGIDTLRLYSGYSGGWATRQVSLDTYAGQTVRIGFRLSSDVSVQYAGWYLDDLRVLKELPDTLTLHLLNAEISEFPVVYIKMKVDSFSLPVSGLVEQDLQVWEDGQPVTSFVLYPPSAGGGVSAVDFVFMVDNSGSMSDDIEAVKTNIHRFVTALASYGLDYALGALSFGQDANGGNPIVYNQGQLTQDVQTFLNIVDQFGASGGFEPGWDAIVTALQQFQFRPGAVKVLILITDENVTDDANQGNATYQDALQALQSHGAILFALIDDRPNSYQDYGTLAEATGGAVFHVQDPMETILDSISVGVTSFWTLQYTTPNPQRINQWRTVVVRVSYAGTVEQDTLTYNPMNLIVIRPAGMLDSVIRYGFPLPEGMDFPIEVEVSDSLPPWVHKVEAYVQVIGDSTRTWRTFTLTPTGTRWSVILPGSLITRPGLKLRIAAEDSLSRVLFPPFGELTLAAGPARAPWVFHWHRDTVHGDADLPLVVVSDSLDSLIVEIRKSGDLYAQRLALALHNRRVSLQQAIDSIVALTGSAFSAVQDSIQHEAQRAGLSLSLHDSVWFFTPALNALPGTLSVYLYRFEAVSGFFHTPSPPTGWWSVMLIDSLLPVPPEAYTFAPVFVMERGSRVEPVYYEDFLNQTSVLRVEGGDPAVEISTVGERASEEDLASWAETSSPCEKYYLSLPDILRPGGTAGFHRHTPRSVHVRVHKEGGAKYIEYLLFFPVNDGVNLHEGDWERVILKFDHPDDPEPSEVWLSYHWFWWRLSWNDLPKMGSTHPVIGIHKGSHALTPPVANPGLPFRAYLPPEVERKLRDVVSEVCPSCDFDQVRSAMALLGEFARGIVTALYAVAPLSSYHASLQERLNRLVDDLEFRAGTSRSDTLYPESYAPSRSTYVLRSVDAIAWSTEDRYFYWGAPIYKWMNLPNTFFFSLNEGVGGVIEGNRFYILTDPPRGPIRSIPSQVASQPLAISVGVPVGYRWEPTFQAGDGLQMLAVGEGQEIQVRMWTQIPVRETLRMVPDSAPISKPPASVSLRIYDPTTLEERMLDVSPIFREDTLLVIFETEVQGDSLVVKTPVPKQVLHYKLLAVPNPFRIEVHREVTFKVWAEEPGPLEIRILNEAGIPVRRLKVYAARAGEVHVTWDGRTDDRRRVANGVYFVEARGQKARNVGKVIVVRR